MKLTKEIQRLIDKRMQYGELLSQYDGKVQAWCKAHNVDIADIECDYGCMLTAEPYNYAKLTIERIESTD